MSTQQQVIVADVERFPRKVRVTMFTPDLLMVTFGGRKVPRGTFFIPVTLYRALNP